MSLALFGVLQVADVATTLVGMHLLGATETNPVIARLMAASDPITALIVVKLIGVAIVAYAVWSRRPRVVSRLNVIFALIVAWNVAQISKAIYLS